MSKYAGTEYRRSQRVISRLQSIYSSVIAYRLPHTSLLEKLAELYQSSDYKRLTPYYRGYVAGLQSGLDADISRNHLVWMLGPSTGPTHNTHTDPWDDEMSRLCRLPGQLYGAHFWTDDDGKPCTDRPFGEYKPTN